MNVLSMRFYDVLANGQPQACTTNVSASAIVCSVEPFKDSWDVFLCDAHPIICYFYQDIFVICFINAGFNFSLLVAVFDGVVNQVDQYLSDFFLVCVYPDGLLASFLDLAMDVFGY